MDKDITLKIDTKLDTSGAVSGLGSFATAVQGIMTKLTTIITNMFGRVKGVIKFFDLGSVVNGVKESVSAALQALPGSEIVERFSGIAQQFGEKLTTLKASIGVILMPIVGALMSAGNSIMSFFIDVTGAIGSVVNQLFGFAGSTAKLANTAAAGQNALAKATTAAGKAANTAMASFDELNLLQSSAGGGVGNITEPLKSEKKEQPKNGNYKMPEELAGLQAALEPLGKTLWAGLEWGYNNVLKPLGEWTVNSALPGLLGMLSSGLSALGEVLTLLQPLGVWLWEGLLQPLASWAGDLFIAGIEGAIGAFTAVSDWVANNRGALDDFIGGIMPLFEGVGETVMSVLGAIGESLDIWWTSLHDTTAGALELITGLITGNWEQAWQGCKLIFESISTAIVEMLGTMATGILDGLTTMLTTWQELLSPLWEWLDLNIITPIAEDFENMFSFINIIAGIAIDGLMKLFSPLIDYVANKVVTPIVELMKNMWKFITEGARSGLDTMIGWIGDHINRTLDIVASGVNFIIGLINQLIEGINKISFELPDWEALGEYAGLSFGFSISTIPPLKIPHLATGAVIPANREFLALLGDQKSGRNLEAPESLIRQIVREESSGQDGQPIAVNLLLDGDVIYRTVLEREDRRGVRIGGAFANAY